MENVKESVLSLLPNREKVFHLIWDTLEGPLDPELHEFLLSNVELYGSWKEKHRSNGNPAYKGWVYKQRKQGHWLYWYKNGKVHKDVFYRNNEYHGVCEVHKTDGSYEVCEYYKGKLNGERLRYNSEGILFQKWRYEMGESKDFEGPVELGLYKNGPEL
ncbi:toxin-antitoxin system YwqK family antitoxin [Saccharophagus degradans]|uniref:toxin-antitoxin system YwqK family antitoxin n=1 Tax=Saccharophagus degradans TaxID=86304 RepID=UPI00059CE3F2|nr:hypothetical protein [Saccharophagus degradans]